MHCDIENREALMERRVVVKFASFQFSLPARIPTSFIAAPSGRRGDAPSLKSHHEVPNLPERNNLAKEIPSGPSAASDANMIDLGRWAGGDYRIPTQEKPS